ncbi:uncharacterized protein IL334_001552 [Kwoniella shivajii]|uniref:Type 2A phosphatase activator TIP41 n=1 Tax=Kwoniella shivajii TaxID=564305 RepID=A0ABZ1CTE5_9TREE|nr:hypothetical protein IL334_001552 [Kwoniella shivajii]
MTSAPPFTPAPAFLPNSNFNPQYTIDKTPNVQTINIGSWKIEAVKRPILNGKEIDAAEKSLSLPLPEMTFGNNSLRLSYSPSTSSHPSGSRIPSASASDSTSASKEESQVEVVFDSLEALAGVATGEGWEESFGGGVKVSMAEQWKSRSSPNAFSGDLNIPSKPVKPHDWTYSTCYAGSTSGPSTFRPSPTHSLPLPLLARQDPVLDRILFYDDVPLFEDELHDNGESILNVRIRIMPHSFFILSRLFLRVDNVLFRIRDVRLYHALGSDEIVREVAGMEVGYDEVKSHLERQSDLSPLTDVNWVYNQMLSITSRGSYRPNINRSTSSSGESKSAKPWPGLGKVVEVLKLPKNDFEGMREGLESVKI